MTVRADREAPRVSHGAGRDSAWLVTGGKLDYVQVDIGHGGRAVDLATGPCAEVELRVNGHVVDISDVLARPPHMLARRYHE